MATRERRLAEFNGEGEPPPDQPVQVLCEDHSGTYQLPFACRWVDGEWRNHESGGTVEATVVGWRLQASLTLSVPHGLATPCAVSKCDGNRQDFKVRNADGTNRARISGRALYCPVHG